MKLRFFVLVVLVLLQVTAFAQQLVVSVTDDEKKPVELAYVNVYSVDKALLQTVQSDAEGFATVNMAKYPVVLEVVAQGYESFSKRIDQAPAVASYQVSIRKRFASLNEVVVTGVAKPEKLKNALANYQVITKAMMQAQGAVTLNDVLKNQLNTNISNDFILGSNVQMQGMMANKVKILIDGLPVNGREAGSVNLSQINLNNAERIEIVQGPMSVVYGTDALGGVINVITKKNTKPFSINAGTYLESINKYNFDGGLTFRVNDKHQVSLSGVRNFFEGYKSIDQPIWFGDDTLYTKRAFLFKPYEQYLGNIGYGYNAKSGFGLQFNSDYLNEKITNRESLRQWDPFLGAYAFDEYYRTQRIMNRLLLNGKSGKGTWQSQNGYFVYFRNKTRVNKNLNTLEETPTIGKGDQDTSIFSNIYLRGSYENDFKRIRYTVGYDVNLEVGKSAKMNGRTENIQDYALFTNVSAPLINDKLTAQVGVRGSYNTRYPAPVIPSLNLLYTPQKKLQIRGSYSQGFRAPSLKEMYLSFIDQNHNIIGNPGLKAEKGQHAQASASYQVYEKQSNYIQLILTGYYNDVDNQITLVNLNPKDTNSINYQYANITHMQNAIANLQVDGQYKNLYVRLGYSFTNTFEEDGQYGSFTAQEATATGQYSWRKTGLNFSIFYKLIGAQPFLEPSIDGTAVYNGHQDAYSLCDASVEKRFFEKKLQLIVGVKNVFDVRTPQTTGVRSSGAHGGSGAGAFLPRSIFTTLRINIDK